MKFYNDHNFVKHEMHNGTLWIAGWCDIKLHALSNMFSDHEIPNTKGQFAIVWQGNDGWWFAQTDHLCTYPLWYKEDGSAVYSQWKYVPLDGEKDEVFYAQRDLLYGQMTIGSRTPLQEYKRLSPDHCLDSGTPKRYKYSIDVEQNGPIMAHWGDILVESVRKNCRDGDALLLSGGRDSTTIANVASHLGIELNYIHVTRGKENPDTTSCKKFAKNLGIHVHYLDPWQHEFDWNEGEYWHDSSYAPKRQCLQTLGLYSGISGELGASESGSKKINVILQRPQYTIEQLTNIWLTTLEARNEGVASPLVHTDYVEKHDDHRIYKKAYNELIEHYDTLYSDLVNKTDDEEQKLKAVLMLHQQEHESYRLHNYSQDLEIEWMHPFTHPDWCDIIFNAPIKLRQLHHHNREVYRIAARRWKWFDQTAWNYGGPRGLTQ